MHHKTRLSITVTKKYNQNSGKLNTVSTNNNNKEGKVKVWNIWQRNRDFAISKGKPNRVFFLLLTHLRRTSSLLSRNHNHCTVLHIKNFSIQQNNDFIKKKMLNYTDWNLTELDEVFNTQLYTWIYLSFDSFITLRSKVGL